MSLFARSGLLASLGLAAVLAAAPMTAIAAAPSETPEEWVKLGARVHGGFGAFIPLGIRIGLDAVRRMNAQPRQLTVLYYDNDKVPCACFADGVAIATLASFGQRTLRMAAEKAPADAAAVIVIRPRKGGKGFRYTIPMTALPPLQEMNRSLQPLQRHHAVMKAEGLFTVAPE